MHRHVSKTVSNISRVKLSKYKDSFETDVAKIVSLLSCPRPRQLCRIGRLHPLEHRATVPVIKDIIKETPTSTVRVILVKVLLLSKQK